MFENNKIKNRIVQPNFSIIECLKKMDIEKVKLLFIIGEENNFIGILTIGDIQRAIINNIPVSKPISEIIDLHKIYATKEDSLDSIKNKMVALRAECMPVVDEKGNLVDVIFWEDAFGNIHQIDERKLNIPVIIMAGGMGTRLKPLTNVIPKPLIPIGEKTILEVILNRFENIGCSKFYMSVNYKSEMLKYYLDNLEYKYDIEYFEEEKPLGTIGSVSLLKDKITTPFFVSNCDIIIDQDFRDVYDYHTQNSNDITVVTAIKTYQIPYGVINTGRNGIMISLDEKPDISYMINTGVYIIQPELIKEIPENEFFHITHLMEKIKNKGGKIGCFPVSENSWIDIGDWNEYLKIIKQS